MGPVKIENVNASKGSEPLTAVLNLIDIFSHFPLIAARAPLWGKKCCNLSNNNGQKFSESFRGRNEISLLY